MSLSPREFALATGHSLDAVYKALQTGRLSADRLGRNWRIDLEQGLKEYPGPVEPGNTPTPVQEPSQDVPAIEESLAVERFWKARSAELAYRNEAARLVEASMVRASYQAEVAHCREVVQAVMPKITDRAIDASAKDLLIVSELITESLEELGRIYPT